MENTIGPTNIPINPDMMKPPKTPRKKASIGTTVPLPNKMGFNILSESPLKKK
jgi:hypothetical protein